MLRDWLGLLPTETTPEAKLRPSFSNWKRHSRHKVRPSLDNISILSSADSFSATLLASDKSIRGLVCFRDKGS